MDRRSLLVGLGPSLVVGAACAIETARRGALLPAYRRIAPALVRSPIRFDTTAYGAGATIGADNTAALAKAIADAQLQGRDIVLEAAPYIISSLIVTGPAPLYMRGRGGGLTSLKIARGQIPRSGWGVILTEMVDGALTDLAIDLDDASFVRDGMGVVGGFLMSGCHRTRVDLLVIGKYQIGMSQLNCVAPTLKGQVVFTGALPAMIAGETAPAYQKRTGMTPYGIAVLGQGTAHRSALYEGIIIEGRPANGIYSGGGSGSGIINCRCPDGCMTGSAFQLISTVDGRILGNQVRNNGADGINATDASHILIEGNTIDFDDASGFDEGISTSFTQQSKFTGVTVKGNTLSNVFKVGISLGAGAQDCLVEGNTLENCGVRGFAVYGPDPGAWAPICCENAKPEANKPGNIIPLPNTGNLVATNVIVSNSGSIPVGIAELAVAGGEIGRNYYIDNVVSGSIKKAIQLEPTGRSLRRDMTSTIMDLPVFGLINGIETVIAGANARFQYRHDLDRIFVNIDVTETKAASVNEQRIYLPFEASGVEASVSLTGRASGEHVSVNGITAGVGVDGNKNYVTFIPANNGAALGLNASVSLSGFYGVKGGR